MCVNKLIVTFFGVGLAKKAPGTFGTLAAFVISLTFMNVYNFSIICFAIGIITFVLGVICTEIYIKDKQVKDPKEVVIDEVSGYFLACGLTFVYIGKPDIIFLLLTFAIFRLLDIVKPFPISTIDKKMKSGFGVMFDDSIAGAITALLVCGIYDLFF